MSNNQSTNNATNHLIHETSPYLIQHAHNPVKWYPWGDVALAKAKAEDKPILLSIGYSACHWCHVMAHESFEDAATAQVMNEYFINIKVDREERPDLDKIYQLAHQMLTQKGGGWPLTMVLTPGDQTPFFAGTYFPKTARQGMPSFVEILQKVEGYYRHRLDDINKQNASLLQVMDDISKAQCLSVNANAIDPAPMDEARCQLEQIYDGLYGGFGEAPKFPHPTNIERMLRHWSMTKNAGHADTKAFDMAMTTLKVMAYGGIYDQLGGGFCRYSVDQQWMIPHFEKMLYDNGPLLSLYAEAWQATAKKEFKRIAMELGEWVMTEMQSPEGGYYSSLDADTQGVEGKFYVWDRADIKESLSNEEYAVLSQRYGLDKAANFEGFWHFYVSSTLDEISTKTGFSKQDVEEYLSSAKQSLYRIRDLRVHPACDEKILTAWNGLMIKGMAAAGKHLKRPDYITSAQKSLDFIATTLWQDNRLLATYKDGKAHLTAYLDDYVFLLDGILELLQAQFREQDLQFAIKLADTMLAYYEDKQNGGFFFTANDHESLIQRPKVFLDEAIPSGNGIAAHVLLRLGHFLGETRYLDAAENTLKVAWQSIVRTPYAHNALLLAVEEYLYPTQIVVIRGPKDELEPWLSVCQENYAPRRFAVAIAEDIDKLPGALGEQKKVDGAVAYVCSGQQCHAPVGDMESLRALI